MQKFISAFQDDSGATSMMRLTMFLTVVAVLGSVFYNAWLTKTPISWGDNDFKMIGVVVGGKLWQNSQENAVPTPPKA